MELLVEVVPASRTQVFLAGPVNQGVQHGVGWQATGRFDLHLPR